MPILKTEILGSQIEINYEEHELKKLLKLIEIYKKRLSEFHNNGRISNRAIMFLSALKAEDQLQEIKNLLDKSQKDQYKIQDILDINKDLNNKIILLKDELETIQLKNSLDTNSNIKVIKEIEILESSIKTIQKKIKSFFEK